jgi:hypothetical protein
MPPRQDLYKSPLRSNRKFSAAFGWTEIFDHVGFPGECWLQISETIPLFPGKGGRCVPPARRFHLPPVNGEEGSHSARKHQVNNDPLWIIHHSLFGGAARTRRLCGSTDLLRPCKCTSRCNPKPYKSSLSVAGLRLIRAYRRIPHRRVA